MHLLFHEHCICTIYALNNTGGYILVEKLKHDIQRINANLLKINVKNLDKEAFDNRLNRTQMLDKILEERYKDK